MPDSYSYAGEIEDDIDTDEEMRQEWDKLAAKIRSKRNVEIQHHSPTKNQEIQTKKWKKLKSSSSSSSSSSSGDSKKKKEKKEKKKLKKEKKKLKKLEKEKKEFSPNKSKDSKSTPREIVIHD